MNEPNQNQEMSAEEVIDAMFDDDWEDDITDSDIEAELELLEQAQIESADSVVEAEAETEEVEEEAVEDVAAALDELSEAEDFVVSSVEEEVEEEVEATAEVSEPKKTRKQVFTKPSERVNAKLPDLGKTLIVSVNDAEETDAYRQSVVDDLMSDIDSLPKKVGEKAVNAFQAATTDTKLSVYTQAAIDLLREKKTITLKDLRDHYVAPNPRPLGETTASSQASQMFKLLPFLNIAVRNGSSMTIVEDSALAELFKNAA